MADAINLNKTSPSTFTQTAQSPQQTLAPSVSNPAQAAANTPPVAAPNVSTPISQTAGGGASAASSAGLGGGVGTPSAGLGSNVATNPSPVEGVALLPGTPGPSTNVMSSTSIAQLPVYATIADLPAITSSNVRTQAVVTDIGNGTSGLYLAAVIGPPTGWSFISVVA